MTADQTPIQILPETSTEERMHVLGADCWCEPAVETVPARIRHNARSDK